MNNTTVIPPYVSGSFQPTINSITSTPAEELCIRNPYYRTTLIAAFMITVIFSAVENISMWIAFFVNRSIRTHVNAYILSLSLSDFITTATLAWLEIYYVWEYPYWTFGELGSMLQNSFWCLSLVTPFVHITVIAMDRYRAVISMTNHLRQKSWAKELLKIVCMWIYSIGIVLLMAFHFTPAPGYEYQWNVLPVWYYPFIAVHILIPLIVCSVIYIMILRVGYARRKELKRFQTRDKKRDKEFKLARTVGIIIILLYVVWLPVIGMEVVYAVLAHTCVIAQVGTVSVWLTCTSGAIHPIIFLSKNKEYRYTILVKVFGLRCFAKRYQFSSTSTLRTTTRSRLSVPSVSSFVNKRYSCDAGECTDQCGNKESTDKTKSNGDLTKN